MATLPDQQTSVVPLFTERNAAFARDRFARELKIMPSLKTMIIGCVDPRVDPADVLGLQPGEAVIIRNVGGRITPSTFETLTMLRGVAQKNGGDLGPGWNVILLHHTDCGITRLTDRKDLLGHYFGVETDKLDALALSDPYASVALDVAAMKANPALSGALLVSGLVYDVATGRVETVVTPALLQP